MTPHPAHIPLSAPLSLPPSTLSPHAPSPRTHRVHAQLAYPISRHLCLLSVQPLLLPTHYHQPPREALSSDPSSCPVEPPPVIFPHRLSKARSFLTVRGHHGMPTHMPIHSPLAASYQERGPPSTIWHITSLGHLQEILLLLLHSFLRDSPLLFPLAATPPLSLCLGRGGG